MKPLKLCYDTQVECVKTYKLHGGDDEKVFRKGAFYWASVDELWFMSRGSWNTGIEVHESAGAIVALEGLKNSYDGVNTGGWFFVYEKSKSDMTFRHFAEYFRIEKDLLEKELFEI